jgi:superfamily I DNA and/or RNA helicase
MGAFPSREFYNDSLISGINDVANHQNVLNNCSLTWPSENGEIIPTIFVPCASEEDTGGQSKSNSEQVNVVKRLVSLLTPLDGASIAPGISIVTPYSKQKAAIGRALPSIECSTIDGFQGRENDIIIFSTVRSNAIGDLGFLNDERRLNVAWTRAKRALFVIGDKRTLGDHENSPMWKRAIESCPEFSLS